MVRNTSGGRAWHDCCYRLHDCHSRSQPHPRRPAMTWTTPQFTDLRFGFEITMYIANR